MNEPRAAAPRPVVGWLVVAVRIVASSTLAAAITYLYWRLGPDRLDVRTDVIGYPIHADFNIYAYFRLFTSLAILLPGLAFAIDALAARVLWHRPLWRIPPAPAEDLPDHDPWRGRVNRPLALGAHGAILGAVGGAGLSWLARPEHFRSTTLLGAAGLGLALAALAGPWQWCRPQAAGRAAAWLSPLTLLTIAVAAHVTAVRQVPGGAERHVDWLPVWLPVLAAAVGVALIGRRLRSAGPEDVFAIERRSFFAFAVPVAVVVLLIRLPGATGPLDAYHDGELLATVDLLRRGFDPWRELFFIHGLMYDVIRPGLGMVLVERSRWGAVAGESLILGPLYWVGLYFLNRYLLGRNWVLLATTVVLVVNGNLWPGDLRFVLQPFVLLALAGLLAKPTRGRALLFSAIAVVHWIITPEATFLLVACAVVIASYELYYRVGRARLTVAFRRTLWCGAAALGLLAGWFLVLAATRVLSGYLLYFRTFAPNHELTGGLPIDRKLPYLWWAALAPGVAAVAMLVIVGSALRAGRRLANQDWVALALAIFTILYYRKFLSRADGHVYEVLAQALPLIAYLVARLVDGVAAGIARRRLSTYRPLVRAAVSVAVVAAVVVPRIHTAVESQLSGRPLALRADVPAEVAEAKIGYAVPGAVDPTLLRDLRTTLASLNPDDGRVFDMTNGPALFYYLLEQRPITRYFHISMAIRHHTQQDALHFLRRDRPVVAVMDGSMGLPVWDGVPNNVRHYELFSYVLAHYRPVVTTHNYLFLVRNDLPVPDATALAARLGDARTEGLLAGALPCAWQHAPESFSDPTWVLRGGPRVRLDVAAQSILTVSGWAGDPADGRLPRRVVAVAGDVVIATGSVGGSRPDVVAAMGRAELATSGFTLEVAAPATTDVGAVEVYAVWADGTASPLGRPSGAAPVRSRLPSGEPVRSPAVGSVDNLAARPGAVVATFPAGSAAGGFTHLEVRSARPFGDATFEVKPADVTSNPISFATDADDGTTYVVKVDNCPQWHAVGAAITITSSDQTPITEVWALR
jgi:hypothetical protein